MWCGKLGLPDAWQEIKILGRFKRRECEVRTKVRPPNGPDFNTFSLHDHNQVKCNGRFPSRVH